MNRISPFFAAFTTVAAISIVIGSWAPFQWQSAETAQVWRSFLNQGSSGDFSRSDVVTNFWLGFPLVFGISGLVRAHSGTLSRRLLWILLILVAQACLAMIAELGQGWLTSRIPSVADFMLQMAGAVSAIFVWQWIGWKVETKMLLAFGQVTNKSEWNRLDAALTFVATGILLWTIMPLDVIVSPIGLGRELLKTELVPFTRLEADLSENIYQWLASFFLAVPLGLFLSRRLAKNFSGKFSLITVTSMSIATGVLPEVCQFPIDSRVASATDALFGVLGAFAGILIGFQFSATRFRWAKNGIRELAQTSECWFALATIQALTICAVAWMPYDFSREASVVAERFELFLSQPFSGLGGSNLQNGLTLFRQAILAAILGVFLGLGHHYLKLRYPYSILGILAIIFAMVVFAAGVEFVQLIVDSRTGEAIGIFIRSAGSLLGLVAALVAAEK